MALNTTASAGLSVEMKTYYDRLLLSRTLPELVWAKFGQTRNIPAHEGKTIEFRRFAGLAVATTPLVEGALYTNLKDITVTAITATIAQYGDAVGFSDLVATTTIDPVLTETDAILGEQAAETIDELVRNVVIGGTSVIYASTAVSRATVGTAMIFTPSEVRRAVLQLKLNRARKINGFYQCILNSRSAFDLQGSAEWITANQFAQSGRQFDGSLGELYGVKFWETDKAPSIDDAGVGSATTVYIAVFFGANAYGVVSLAGQNLHSIYKPLGSAGTADPLDQQQTMGWKCGFVTVILNDLFMIRLEHATSTGDNA